MYPCTLLPDLQQDIVRAQLYECEAELTAVPLRQFSNTGEGFLLYIDAIKTGDLTALKLFGIIE